MTDKRVNITLTFATDAPATQIATAVALAVGKALPDELIGINWHGFTIDEPSTDES